MKFKKPVRPSMKKRRAQEKDRPAHCHYCSKLLAARVWTWDHIVPKALGGTRAKGNLVPACQRCNLAKADSLPLCRCGKCTNAFVRFRKRWDMHGNYCVYRASDGQIFKYAETESEAKVLAQVETKRLGSQCVTSTLAEWDEKYR